MNPELVYQLFFAPGEVVEIRAYGLSRTSPAWEGFAAGEGVIYGYFDNAKSFGKAAAALDKKKAEGIYFTINPCQADLISRASNRLKAARGKTPLTADKDIKVIRWIPVDIDPVRVAGISATDAEVKSAIALRNKIIKWVKQELGADGIPAMSGNGAHYAIKIDDMPPTDENKNRIRNALAGLANKFDTKKMSVDQVVYNPARIWKLYGTTVRKGDHTSARPHRVSYIEPKFLSRKK